MKISNLENSPNKVRFEAGSFVYTKGGFTTDGYVLTTYRKRNGHIYCVVETDHGTIYILEQTKLFLHKQLPPLASRTKVRLYSDT